VNDILEANLEGLKKVYEYYFEPRKKYMTMADALRLMMHDTPLAMSEKDAKYCYGMCKMTVLQEMDQSWQYKQLQFVELLEMLGRIAEFKFRETELEGLELAKKLEYILDDVLSLVEVSRKDVNIQVDEKSESDDDY